MDNPQINKYIYIWYSVWNELNFKARGWNLTVVVSMSVLNLNSSFYWVSCSFGNLFVNVRTKISILKLLKN